MHQPLVLVRIVETIGTKSIAMMETYLSATGTYYKILRIEPSSNKLVISTPPILKNTCYSSDLFMGGLLLDESLPFNISTQNTVMLFNCSDNILQSPLSCSSNSICRQFLEFADSTVESCDI
ncbi:Wall-associated receptor kinase-like 15 [Glycine max]|nr:Wall-associated receptor kinase-like 15 [Glycine max]